MDGGTNRCVEKGFGIRRYPETMRSTPVVADSAGRLANKGKGESIGTGEVCINGVYCTCTLHCKEGLWFFQHGEYFPTRLVEKLAAAILRRQACNHLGENQYREPPKD
jgi:hypothetical protein